MTKIISAIVISLVVLVAVVLFADRDQLPAGEGSYREAEEIDAVLRAIDPRENDAELPEDCYRIAHDDRFYYIAMGTDSHLPGSGGGTVGVLFADGSRHFFFGHVCGPGARPLEFQGRNKEELLAGLRTDWHEYKP